MVENEEFVDYSTLRTLIEIDDDNLFEVYLSEIFKDLTERAESCKKQGIGKITFYDYMKLQIFISEKLFIALDKDSDNFLSQKEFVEGLKTLYFGSFKNTCNLIFYIFDFDKDGLINKGDIKITMSYLPLTDTTHKVQMESLSEIDNLLDIYFGKSDNLNFDNFINIVQNVKSDLYLQLLCFIYENKPFSKFNVEAYKNFKKKKNDSPGKSKTCLDKENVLLSSPSRKSKLLPATQFLGLNLKSDEEEKTIALPVYFKKKGGNDYKIDIIEGEVIRLANTTNKEGESILDSPTKFLRKPIQNTGFSICLKDMNSNQPNSTEILNQYASSSPTKKKKIVFSHEDYVYKITENENVKNII